MNAITYDLISKNLKPSIQVCRVLTDNKLKAMKGCSISGSISE